MYVNVGENELFSWEKPIFVLFLEENPIFVPFFGVAMSYFPIFLTFPITWHPTHATVD